MPKAVSASVTGTETDPQGYSRPGSPRKPSGNGLRKKTCDRTQIIVMVADNLADLHELCNRRDVTIIQEEQHVIPGGKQPWTVRYMNVQVAGAVPREFHR